MTKEGLLERSELTKSKIRVAEANKLAPKTTLLKSIDLPRKWSVTDNDYTRRKHNQQNPEASLLFVGLADSEGKPAI